DINSRSISDDNTSDRSEEPIKLNDDAALTYHASTGSEKEPIKSDTIKSTPKRKSTEYVRLYNATHANFSSGKVTVNPRIPVGAFNVLEQAGLIHRNESGNPELRIPECDFGGEM
ncbi:hypothetical protein, partial [Endozoicomonas sp. ONNA2]|uniref:hypothetical protein n=1 Tax=Endozoicomonas sp. ONNA2 TaxID=2828741 RepID=UPI0021484102